MKVTTLSQNERAVLAILAAMGFLVPNGLFIFFVLMDPAITREAFTNPIALVFIAEAFFLMFLFAWLLGKMGSHRPSAMGFVAMSLIGSLAFSVPATLWVLFRRGGLK